jgi:hypothetical protein
MVLVVIVEVETGQDALLQPVRAMGTREPNPSFPARQRAVLQVAAHTTEEQSQRDQRPKYNT